MKIELIDDEAQLPDPHDKAEFGAYCEMITARECLAVMARAQQEAEGANHLGLEHDLREAQSCDSCQLKRFRKAFRHIRPTGRKGRMTHK